MATKKKAAKTKKHTCRAGINKTLAPLGIQLQSFMILKGAPERFAVAVERIPGTRGKMTHVMASFCPFCGLKLPE